MMKNVQGDLSDQGNHHMEDQEVSDGGGVCEKLREGFSHISSVLVEIW